jgi:hypothetical protein
MANESFRYHVETALWTVFVAASYKRNFYWTLTSISFLTARLYYVGLLRKRPNGAETQEPPPHSEHADPPRVPCGAIRFVRRLKYVSKWMGFAVLLVWCCSLTPFHVLTPTFLDLWTEHSEHPPLKSVDVLYDPGGDSIVEYEALWQ